MKMNKKKALPIMLLALLYKKALAYIWLVIGILVLVVGLYIAYKLNQLIKRVLPDTPPDQTNNVTRVWLTDSNYSGWVYDDSPLASGSSLSEEPLVLAGEAVAVAPFSLQYGLSSISTNGPNGWVASGTSIETVQFSDSVGTNLDNYSFTMTGYGQAFRIACSNGVYNTEVLDVNNSTYQVRIERSTNLINWDPVFTNSAVGVYSVENYMDTNAPPAQGFYRLKIAPNPN